MVSSLCFSVESGTIIGPRRIGVYGSGGVGKSSLFASLPSVGIKPLFIDVGDGTRHLPVDRITGIALWEDLRAALNSKELLKGYGAVIIDDMTKAEEMAADWVVRNIRHEKGKPINGIEDYGWGKGLSHIYDEFIKIFSDLDAIVRDGLHVGFIAHECIENVPNPEGDDWKRYEPRLQAPKSGKDSIRHRLKEWCDYLFFIGYDTAVTEDGKGRGAGTRTIYTSEMPTWIAKRRVVPGREMPDSIAYERGGVELWNEIFGKGN